MANRTGRWLGLDHGERRVGVAISDPTGTIATPRGFLEARGEAALIEAIAALLERELESDEGPIIGIVVGDPRHMSGEASPGSEAVASLCEGLVKRVDVPVVRWDERLTTAMAESALREAGVRGRARRKRVDAVAAALILQSYLEFLRNRGGA